jgi:hypothetical protein
LETQYFNGLAQEDALLTLEVGFIGICACVIRSNVYTVWAATSRNEDYLRMEGMKRVVDDPAHRQEVVAGNMSEYLTKRKQKN